MPQKLLVIPRSYRSHYNDGRVVQTDWNQLEASYRPSGQTPGNFHSPTEFSYVSERVRGLSGNIFDRTSATPSSIYLKEGDFGGGDLAFLSEPDLEAAAYNQAVAKLGDLARGSVDWTVTAFQAGQTGKMLSSGLKLVSYATDFYRKFRHNPVKALGEKWLEYQYGWKPLVSDCYNSLDYLMKKTQDGNIRVIGRGTQTQDWSDIVSIYAPDGTYQVPIRRNANFTHSVRLVAWLKPPNGLQSVSNYTSLNPLSIAWELVPFSFVADWVFDVGGYLRGLETALSHSSRFVSGYRNDLRVFKSELSCSGSPSNRPKREYILVGGGGTRVTFQRRVLAGFPCPKLPRFSFDLGSGRLLNAAALLSTLLKGR